ncbi:putative ABC transport system ATP-binding protein [Tahibacter aquaticus]|uniref:Putative ABC transport system ATP-binding protein n=1 Tax=Tahibacter aquaticus TaxID=520092 RepID=A0A4R6Z0N7_9GAMM|nr:ABC transporter ATP-binding protein [Tahibacter aquaticus]TDR45088.1 putative ABC transport system ATP-binding protein [Tahibacter aquaticus]
MTQAQPLIQLQDLQKSFFTEEVETRALQGINLSIWKGEYVSFSGPSGCGKSTLLSLLGLLDVWTSGKYLLAGHDVSTVDRDERARIRNKEIGFVFQSFNLISDLTVEENVALPLTYRADLKKGEIQALVSRALDKVEMSHRAKHYPTQLSGGQQQRVAVARAVAGNPSLILADEPTGNLDSKNAEIVTEMLENLHAEGSTVCMVTHNPETAARAPRRVELLDGQIASNIVVPRKIPVAG